MKQAPPLGGLRPVHPAAFLGLVLPAAALTAIAVWGGPDAPAPLLAATTSHGAVFDTDGDAIPDDQELTLNLAVLNVDNDQDGWEDPIEIAHGTSPFDALDTPASTALMLPGIGITARTDGANMRLCIVMHAPAGSLAAKNARFGLLLGGVLYPLPVERLGLLRETFTADFGANGSVEVWDMPFPTTPLIAHGALTVVAAVGTEGQSSYSTAEVLDMTGVDGTVLMRRKKALTPGQGHAGFLMAGDQDTVHQPIPTFSTPVPSGWFAGRVCYQRAITVGVSGSRIIREVVEAECRPNWDSYCDPDCLGTVGSLIESIDPGTLVGG